MRYMTVIRCTAKKPNSVLEFPSRERELIDPFLATLRGLPDVRVEAPRKLQPSAGGPKEIDAVLDLEIRGRPITLIIEMKRAGYPRDVRDAVWQLRNYIFHLQPQQKSEEAVLFFITESLSPGAKEFLKNEKIGYFDLGGNLYLPAESAYFYIEKSSTRRETRTLRSLFTGKRALVLHFVFFQRDWFGVTELAEKSGASASTVSEVLSELEKREWTESRGHGPSKERRLTNGNALLDAWSAHQRSSRPPKLRRYFVSSKGVGNLAHRLSIACDEHEIRYVVTGEMAAQHYAQYLSSISQVRCRMLETKRIGDALHQIDARVVNEGWNLAVIETRQEGEFAFSQRIEGICMASPLQTYLDLLQGDGRSKEMAEHLRQERLKI